MAQPLFFHKYKMVFSGKRVGFFVEGRAPVREGSMIIDNKGLPVGKNTSCGIGPTIDAPVAMGYIDMEHSTIGTCLNALVREKRRPACVAKTPSVPHRHLRGYVGGYLSKLYKDRNYYE